MLAVLVKIAVRPFGEKICNLLVIGRHFEAGGAGADRTVPKGQDALP